MQVVPKHGNMGQNILVRLYCEKQQYKASIMSYLLSISRLRRLGPNFFWKLKLNKDVLIVKIRLIFTFRAIGQFFYQQLLNAQFSLIQKAFVTMKKKLKVYRNQGLECILRCDTNSTHQGSGSKSGRIRCYSLDLDPDLISATGSRSKKKVQKGL